MIAQLKKHRGALLVILAVTLLLMAAGAAQRDTELALLPLALPVGVLAGLWYEARA